MIKISFVNVSYDSYSFNDMFIFLWIGGAGTGKSFTIKIVAKYAEKILRMPGDHPNRPKVILLGPTGIAANLIGKLKNFAFKIYIIIIISLYEY